jgi:hypothetical protein
MGPEFVATHYARDNNALHVQAVILTAENFVSVCEWLGDQRHFFLVDWINHSRFTGLTIPNPNVQGGHEIINMGGYVVKFSDGSFSLIDRMIFERMYAAIEKY